MYRPAERELADGESRHASLIGGVESFSRQQTSGLVHHPLGAAGRYRDVDRTLIGRPARSREATISA